MARTVDWMKGARRDLDDLLTAVATDFEDAIIMLAEGATLENAKPLSGFNPPVRQLTVKNDGETYRLLFTLFPTDRLTVVHVFHKKSKKGAATPQHEIDTAKDRLAALKKRSL